MAESKKEEVKTVDIYVARKALRFGGKDYAKGDKLTVPEWRVTGLTGGRVPFCAIEKPKGEDAKKGA